MRFNLSVDLAVTILVCKETYIYIYILILQFWDRKYGRWRTMMSDRGRDLKSREIQKGLVRHKSWCYGKQDLDGKGRNIYLDNITIVLTSLSFARNSRILDLQKGLWLHWNYVRWKFSKQKKSGTTKSWKKTNMQQT